MAVEALLYHLETGALAEPAALALHLLTGAELYEDVLIPEAIDEDELFDDELEALREKRAGLDSGETAPEGDGTEVRGTTLTRLTQDLETWRAWWGQRAWRMRSGK